MKNLPKRMISLLLCTALLLTGVPFGLSTYAEAAWEGYKPNSLILDKTAVLEDNGTYTVTMEAFSTGTVSTTTTPLDIVLVLDQSNSMSLSMPGAPEGNKEWVSVSGSYEKLLAEAALYYVVGDTFYEVHIPEEARKLRAIYTANDKDYITDYEYTTKTLICGDYTVNLDSEHIPEMQVVYTLKSSNGDYYYVDDEGTQVTTAKSTKANAFTALNSYHESTYSGYDFRYASDYSVATSYVLATGYGYKGLTMTYETENGTQTLLESSNAYKDSTCPVQNLYIYTRMAGLKYAVNSFLEKVQENAATYEVDHRVAMVGFASGSTVTSGGTTYNEYSTSKFDGTEILSASTPISAAVATYADYKAALLPVSRDDDLNATLRGAIDELEPTDLTFLNYGLQMADIILDQRDVTTYVLPDGTEAERKTVVIVFTDGIPGRYTSTTLASYDVTFNDKNPLYALSAANRAITVADEIKADGTDIYTIGLIEGADPTADYNFTPRKSTDIANTNDIFTFYDTTTQATNAYLHFLSSDYEKAVDMLTPDRSTVVNNGYFHSAQDAEQLSEVFDNLSSTIGASEISMTGDAALYDQFTEGFDLPADIEENSEVYITAQVADYLGGGKWSEPYDDIFLSVSADYEDRSIRVQGFDYSSEYVTEKPDGKKLIVTVRNITANDKAITDRDYPTNTEPSGVYTDDTLQTLVESFEPPKEQLRGESYVLDGSKPLVIDPSDVGMSIPGHISTDGMLYFDPDSPIVGSENQGTLEIIDGKLVYTPSAATWIDVFYVFGTDANGDNVWARLEIHSTAAHTLYLDKDAVLEDDGTYTVTLDAFTTGEVKAHSAPMDIVLVVDQSSSMSAELTDVTADFEQLASATKVTGQTYGKLMGYKKLYYVADGKAHELTITQTGGKQLATYYNDEKVLVEGDVEVSSTVTFTSYGDFEVNYEHVVEEQEIFVCKTSNLGNYAYFNEDTGENVTGWVSSTSKAYEALKTYREENYPQHTIFGRPSPNGIYINPIAFLKKVQGYVWVNTTYKLTYTPAGGYPVTVDVHTGRPDDACNIDGLYIYTRNDAIKASALGFMEGIWDDADKYGLDHRVAMVGFASGTNVPGYSDLFEYATNGEEWENTELLSIGEPISYPNITTENYKAALQNVNVGGRVNPNLISAINYIDPAGQTYTNYGMRMAKSILDARDVTTYEMPNGEDALRKTVVILFTDGTPGSYTALPVGNTDTTFGDMNPRSAVAVANRTIAVADEIKAGGALVYVVGMIDGVDPAAEYDFEVKSTADIDSEADVYHYYYSTQQATNAYLHFLSSDYEKAVNMETPDRSTVVNNGFVFSASDSEALGAAFKSIVENVGVSKLKLDENAVLYDVFTTGFDLPADFAENIEDYVSVYAADYEGNGAWGERRELSFNAADGTGIQVTAASDGEALPEGGTKTNAIKLTGYDYSAYYVTEKEDDHEATGQKLIVVIRKVEANDAAITESDYNTNKPVSAIYSDATLSSVTEYFPIPDELLQKETYLVTDDQPLTIDPTDVGITNPVHLDSDGMHEFDPDVPTTVIAEQGTVEIVDGKLVFTPPEGEWNVIALYIFGTDENGENVWAKIYIQPPYYASYVIDYAKPITVPVSDFGLQKALHLDAAGQNDFETAVTSIEATYGSVCIADGTLTYTPNTAAWGGYDTFYVYGIGEEGNEAWATITVLPANNVFFEDDFGVTYSADWSTVGEARNNTETPNNPIHGYIEGKEAEADFSDGTAHYTKTHGATAEFTFTGTGVDIYCRTDVNCGITIALLTRAGETAAIRYLNVDNESVSDGGSGYYQIPTIFFHGLACDTYTVKIIVTSDNGTDGYYLDGYRVYNPLAEAQNDAVVQQAYGVETNASFETVRQLLLDAGTLAADGKADGYVFLDKVLVGGKEGYQQAVESNDVAAYTAVGPKNEVYLASGQSIVFKMEVVEGASYFVGLKTPNGKTGEAEYTFGESKKAVKLNGASDQYYEIIPSADGYVMITNTGSDMIAVTKLRSTLPAQQTFSMRKVSVRHLLAYANGFDAAEVGEDIEPIAQTYTIANTQLKPEAVEPPIVVEPPAAMEPVIKDLSRFTWVKKPAPIKARLREKR